MGWEGMTEATIPGTATDAPTITPGLVMHSCSQHQDGGSASLGVWEFGEACPGVEQCWAGAGQGRAVSVCLCALYLHELFPALRIT
jgi:hypothetical protein